jgi:hypothetical protein
VTSTLVLDVRPEGRNDPLARNAALTATREEREHCESPRLSERA